MNNLLDKIIATKKKEILERKEIYPAKLLEKGLYYDSPCLSLKSYLERSDLSGIIAEIKRASPSAGILNQYIKVDKLSIGYMQAGASALSVLTDTDFFKGSLEDLKVARRNNFCPILRKDFILDEYQILEARSSGADAILLIAKILTVSQFKSLSAFARSLGMQVLLEVHNLEELESYPENETNLIGVNSRNLDTLEIDHQFTHMAVSKIPKSVLPIAESGIRQPEDVINLKKIGYRGFLIGQLFMQSFNPALACKKFISSLSGVNLNA